MARILITEDDPLVRNLVRATLDFGEHELIEAPDGPSALALATAALPDLVILDLHLPNGVDGVDILKKVRAGRPQARVIILTGSGREHEKRALDAGAMAFLTKPFSPLTLIERIEAALGRV
ncbi:MAG TPA: response regulator [Planctomycetota bacterium]|nr:response regulator [Planctomycetota bacterium]